MTNEELRQKLKANRDELVATQARGDRCEAELRRYRPVLDRVKASGIVTVYDELGTEAFLTLAHLAMLYLRDRLAFIELQTQLEEFEVALTRIERASGESPDAPASG